MTRNRWIGVALAGVLVAGTATTGAWTFRTDKHTEFTFSGPVTVPGVTLPAAPVDWPALARAAGLRHVETVAEPAGLGPALAAARRAPGPALLVLPIAFDPLEAIPPYSERPAEIRTRFKL